MSKKDQKKKQSDSMRQLRESMSQSSDSVRQLRESMSQSSDSMRQLRESISQPSDSMRQLRESMSQSSDSVRQLRESMSQSSDSVRQLRESISQPSDSIRQLRESMMTNRGAITHSWNEAYKVDLANALANVREEYENDLAAALASPSERGRIEAFEAELRAEELELEQPDGPEDQEVANERSGKLQATVSGFEFSAVGTVSSAMHTVSSFDAGPVRQLLGELSPHELELLVKKTLPPERLSFEQPEGVTENEFPEVMSALSGAELLDRERRLQQAERVASRSTARTQIAWNVIGPILGLLVGAIVTYFIPK